mmetsp:Transcript_14175/g.19757  ORF Transcript_14175/g.19757 Transcript_14175/m.19757 type:complete len:503 (+) Transcript_14175:174-1682(+)|eukprot:CAMPEP_0168557292 /NCGR_PEP_ID=MMETSP0413-20121227/9348_1 /TAXON_ID=136452 /ORGANISM="Filamoeba nolandi, Strain NC-AS-23-1" /LENGTH=502 /DNA_ID=CAMNT_0008588315 /DNA_START=173 /DNA_END=1681 /DNA_ORIENTATION=-
MKRVSVYLVVSCCLLVAVILNFVGFEDDRTVIGSLTGKPHAPDKVTNEILLRDQKIATLQLNIARMKAENENLDLINQLRNTVNRLETDNFKLHQHSLVMEGVITQPLIGGNYTVIAETPYDKGPWLASPTLIKTHNGTYIACFDTTREPVGTHVAVSHDSGKTWKETAVIPIMRWPNLVEVNNQVYVVGVDSIEQAGLKVSKMITYSRWTDPIRIVTDISSFHTGNVGIVIANEELHIAIQTGRRSNWTIVHASVHADLMDKTSWQHSNTIPEPVSLYYPQMKALMGIEEYAHAQEGVLVPWNGSLVAIARVSDSQVCAMAALFYYDLEVKQLSFMRFAYIPGLGIAKPAVVYDLASNLYWMLSNYNRDMSRDISKTHIGYIEKSHERCLIDRSILGLFYATQPMGQWHLAGFVAYSPDWAHHATYPSMLIEGDDVIAAVRSHLDTPLTEETVNHGQVIHGFNMNQEDVTANNHNANKISFHRIKNFRDLVHPMMYYDTPL